MQDFFRPLISPELSVIQILPQTDRVVLVARPTAKEACCPCCGLRTGRVHSHYQRRLADLPWHGRVVEVRLQAPVAVRQPELSAADIHGEIARNSAAESSSHSAAGRASSGDRLCSGRGAWLALVAKAWHAGQWRHVVANGRGGRARTDRGGARDGYR
ncbi:transposase family protein [Rhizobium mongolense]|uniref:transposase family protein n=1 Tax=Rhizobium mongolense TaxID=57676 RepID=UPI003558B542